jgi:hypothetical protein
LFRFADVPQGEYGDQKRRDDQHDLKSCGLTHKFGVDDAERKPGAKDTGKCAA